ncbi:putative general transcription factor II-I repeat domain-containing protein 2-like [Triplophysa rosa]|uniref:General transcription factor II-I repeat domain-containing protein 2-like n=1 Tax=Triplophysa rosa TaxID=992332 RepID=A0A9W7WLY1_TRIRA|nr:putative general transcription factor II-I repeat domain-containing protein 2-like [Triplophysa rosa]
MSVAKKRKVDSECRVFNEEWTTKYFFTSIGQKAVCLICHESIAVFKDYNLSRHFSSKHSNYAVNLSSAEKANKALKLATNLKAQQNTFTKQCAIQESVTKASYVVAHKIAKHSKPFSDGEFVKNCMVQFEKISLSRRTITRRVEVIDEELFSELKKKADGFSLFSIALDESTDIAGTAQLLIFVRGINENFEISEELLGMESMMGTTRGVDLYDSVSVCLGKNNLPWGKLTSVTTDGSPNLTGKNTGLLKRLQDKVKDECLNSEELIFLHCIIHQEALCKSVLKLENVVKVVVKLVNFIRARALNHRQFIQLLNETEAEHHDLLYHSNVRWLSLGKVFHRVWELKAEIATFLNTVGKTDDFPELQDTNWLTDLAFGVDTLRHLNDLNLKLQGKDVFAHELYSNVKAFKAKLVLFSRHISSRDFAHFPTLGGLSSPIKQSHIERYSSTLSDLHAEFSRRFTDFAKIETELEHVSCPLSFDSENAPPDTQLELIDIQCDITLKEKFQTTPVIQFYASLDENKFPNIKKHAQRMLVLFGSTYVCEQTYSIMNYNKAHCRSNLTNSHLSAILRISTSKITPDFDTLARRGDQAHCSH